MTTAGLDKIDTDLVKKEKEKKKRKRKRKKKKEAKEKRGLMFEKQYFSSQIITSAIMFLTNGNPGPGSRVESCPQFKQNGQSLTQTAKKMARPPFALAEKGSLERRQMAASTHSILMACNRVGYTYVTTHFLI